MDLKNDYTFGGSEVNLALGILSVVIKVAYINNSYYLFISFASYLRIISCVF